MSMKSVMTRSLIGAKFHSDHAAGYIEVIEVFCSDKTGTVVYRAIVFDKGHEPIWGWFYVATPTCWKTTATEILTGHGGEHNYYRFDSIEENEETIELKIMFGTKPITDTFVRKNMRAYDEKDDGYYPH